MVLVNKSALFLEAYFMPPICDFSCLANRTPSLSLSAVVVNDDSCEWSFCSSNGSVSKIMCEAFPTELLMNCLMKVATV